VFTRQDGQLRVVLGTCLRSVTNDDDETLRSQQVTHAPSRTINTNWFASARRRFLLAGTRPLNARPNSNSITVVIAACSTTQAYCMPM